MSSLKRMWVVILVVGFCASLTASGASPRVVQPVQVRQVQQAEAPPTSQPTKHKRKHHKKKKHHHKKKHHRKHHRKHRRHRKGTTQPTTSPS